MCEENEKKKKKKKEFIDTTTYFAGYGRVIEIKESEENKNETK